MKVKIVPSPNQTGTHCAGCGKPWAECACRMWMDEDGVHYVPGHAVQAAAPDVEWGPSEEIALLRGENDTLRERLQSTHALLGEVSGQVRALQAENEALKHDIERHLEIASREAEAREAAEKRLAEMRQVWGALHKELGEHPKGPVVALCEKLEAAEKREQEALAAVREMPDPPMMVWTEGCAREWQEWRRQHAAVIKRVEGE